MRTYTVEIETDLSDLVSSAIEEIKDTISYLYLKDGSIDETMDKYSIVEVLEYDGTLHEIIDGSVPVYTAQLEALMFVHKQVLMEAFEDAEFVPLTRYSRTPILSSLALKEWRFIATSSKK